MFGAYHSGVGEGHGWVKYAVKEFDEKSAWTKDNHWSDALGVEMCLCFISKHNDRKCYLYELFLNMKIGDEMDVNGLDAAYVLDFYTETLDFDYFKKRPWADEAIEKAKTIDDRWYAVKPKEDLSGMKNIHAELLS